MTSYRSNPSEPVREMYDQRNAVKSIDDLLARTSNPRHVAILRNFRRHALFELSGNWPWILSPGLTVDHPHYRFNIAPETQVFDGLEEVAKFYHALTSGGLDPLVGPITQRLMVDDWGWSGHGVWGQQLPAAAADAEGIPVDDADDHYYLVAAIVQIWFYSDEGKLIGEHVFADRGSRLWWKMDPADVLSLDEAHARIQPLLDEEIARYGAPAEPYPSVVAFTESLRASSGAYGA